ncbi:uncharacterized protein F4812DRAFT_262273 [Daldinia caldariorum]|uniref:uncharacterized protein n=1 Tax=Daldinia caldariorum TaxID=326644 RepID=UPI002008AF3A|nr:uncharacterized protein F4812DRAFT_262273 [Daldinia caldariorum]KAI1470348.1 hypothetical protein F4812DRAFT_262273 [Daldinia caldariorum]
MRQQTLQECPPIIVGQYYSAAVIVLILAHPVLDFRQFWSIVPFAVVFIQVLIPAVESCLSPSRIQSYCICLAHSTDKYTTNCTVQLTDPRVKQDPPVGSLGGLIRSRTKLGDDV